MKIILTIAALIALAVPAVAQADGYNLTQRQAQRDAQHSAFILYDFGSDPVHSYCWPQGHMPANAKRLPKIGGYYHRWACVWQGGGSWGELLVAGNSDGDYSYRVILGMRDS